MRIRSSLYPQVRRDKMDIRNILDGTRAEIVGLLIDDPHTIQEICAELDLSPTAVREHIYNLKSKKLIDERRIREGPGRPVHEYSLSDTATTDGQETFQKLIETCFTSLIEESAEREEVSSVITSMLSTLLSNNGGIHPFLNQLGVSYTSAQNNDDETVLVMQSCPFDYQKEQERLINNCFEQAIEETMECDVLIEDRVIEGEERRTIQLMNRRSN